MLTCRKCGALFPRLLVIFIFTALFSGQKSYFTTLSSFRLVSLIDTSFQDWLFFFRNTPLQVFVTCWWYLDFSVEWICLLTTGMNRPGLSVRWLATGWRMGIQFPEGMKFVSSPLRLGGLWSWIQPSFGRVLGPLKLCLVLGLSFHGVLPSFYWSAFIRGCIQKFSDCLPARTANGTALCH
jgi:hypothetical protein